MNCSVSPANSGHPVLFMQPGSVGAEHVPVGKAARHRWPAIDARQHLLAPSVRCSLAQTGDAPQLVAPTEQPHVLEPEHLPADRLRHICRRQNFARSSNRQVLRQAQQEIPRMDSRPLGRSVIETVPVLRHRIVDRPLHQDDLLAKPRHRRVHDAVAVGCGEADRPRRERRHHRAGHLVVEKQVRPGEVAGTRRYSSIQGQRITCRISAVLAQGVAA